MAARPDVGVFSTPVPSQRSGVDADAAGGHDATHVPEEPIKVYDPAAVQYENLLLKMRPGVMGGIKWMPRWAALVHNGLQVFSAKKAPKRGTKAKYVYALHGSSIFQVGEETNHEFVLELASGQELTLRTQDADTFQAWTFSIDEHIEELEHMGVDRAPSVDPREADLQAQREWPRDYGEMDTPDPPPADAALTDVTGLPEDRTPVPSVQAGGAVPLQPPSDVPPPPPPHSGSGAGVGGGGGGHTDALPPPPGTHSDSEPPPPPPGSGSHALYPPVAAAASGDYADVPPPPPPPQQPFAVSDGGADAGVPPPPPVVGTAGVDVGDVDVPPPSQLASAAVGVGVQPPPPPAAVATADGAPPPPPPPPAVAAADDTGSVPPPRSVASAGQSAAGYSHADEVPPPPPLTDGVPSAAPSAPTDADVPPPPPPDVASGGVAHPPASGRDFHAAGGDDGEEPPPPPPPPSAPPSMPPSMPPSPPPSPPPSEYGTAPGVADDDAVPPPPPSDFGTAYDDDAPPPPPPQLPAAAAPSPDDPAITRALKRAFDDATAFTSGLLPASELAGLCARFGVRLTQDDVAAVTNASSLLSRNEFFAIWRAHAAAAAVASSALAAAPTPAAAPQYSLPASPVPVPAAAPPAPSAHPVLPPTPPLPATYMPRTPATTAYTAGPPPAAAVAALAAASHEVPPPPPPLPPNAAAGTGGGVGVDSELDDIMRSAQEVLAAVHSLDLNSRVPTPESPAPPPPPPPPPAPSAHAVTGTPTTAAVSTFALPTATPVVARAPPSHRSPAATTAAPAGGVGTPAPPAPPSVTLPGVHTKVPLPCVAAGSGVPSLPRVTQPLTAAGVDPAALGLNFPMTKPMQTVEEARLGVRPGDNASQSGRLTMDSFVPSMAAVHRHVSELPFDDDEWNERWQRLLEKQAWSFEKAVERGVGVAAFTSKFTALAVEAAETIVDELPLPVALKSIRPLDADDDDDVGHGADASAGAGIDNDADPLFLHRGLLLRVVSQPDGSDDSIDRKVAGHELHGLRWTWWASDKLYRDWLTAVGPPGASKKRQRRPPPLCTVLACLVDYMGFRLYAMCIPPMDERRTLVYGQADPTEPFVSNSTLLASMLRRVGRHLNLKPHMIDATADVSVTIPLSVNVQGHQCDDHRFYLMNLSQLFPPDKPAPGSSDSLVRTLRPEFVVSYATPLSADTFVSRPDAHRPGDVTDNEVEVAKASQHLGDVTVPQFVKQLESLALCPVDSRQLTAAMHAAGINMRYLSSVASLATLPHLRELAEVEMAARVAKSVLQQNLRRMVGRLVAARRSQPAPAPDSPSARYAAQGHAVLAKREAQTITVELFNLVLGAGAGSAKFWSEVLQPSVMAQFRYALPSRAVSASGTTLHKPQLFHALQYQCGVAVHLPADAVGGGSAAAAPSPAAAVSFMSPRHSGAFTFNTASPITVHMLGPSVSRVYDMLPTGTPLETLVVSSSAEQCAASGEPADELQALNLRLAMQQARGQGNTPDAGDTLCSIADALLRMGRLADAMATAGAAQSRYPFRHAGGARACVLRARALVRSGDVPSGLGEYQRATADAQWHLGRHHPFLATLAVDLVGALCDVGAVPTALDVLREARDMCARVLGGRHPHIAKLSAMVGDLSLQADRPDQAVPEYERALLLQEAATASSASVSAAASSGGKAPSAALLVTADATHRELIAATCSALANALVHLGRLPAALQQADKAFALRHGATPGSEAEVATLQQLAAIHDRLAQPADAIRHLELALDVLKRRSDASAVHRVQQFTQHLIRLAFRALPAHMRSVVSHFIAQRSSGHPHSAAAVPFVISQLFSHASPSAYVTLVVDSVVSGTTSPRLSSGLGTPPAADQLVALALLAEEAPTPSPRSTPAGGVPLAANYMSRHAPVPSTPSSPSGWVYTGV